MIGFYPCQIASMNNKLYSLLNNDHKKYFKNIGHGDASAEFKELIKSMLSLDPK